MNVENEQIGVVAVFDLDGTLIPEDSYITYLLGYLRRSPLRCFRVLHLPFAALLFYMGRRDNTWLKIIFLRAILGRLSRAEIDDWSTIFLDRLMAKSLRLEALAEIEHHREGGATLVLASASLDIYVEALTQRLGFDYIVCTRTAWDDDGRLSGELVGENCYGPAKLRMVETLLTALPGNDRVVFYTDHHSDLPLLARADDPVVVTPTPKLRAVAHKLGYPIRDWR